MSGNWSLPKPTSPMFVVVVVVVVVVVDIYTLVYFLCWRTSPAETFQSVVSDRCALCLLLLLLLLLLYIYTLVYFCAGELVPAETQQCGFRHLRPSAEKLDFPLATHS